MSTAAVSPSLLSIDSTVLQRMYKRTLEQLRDKPREDARLPETTQETSVIKVLMRISPTFVDRRKLFTSFVLRLSLNPNTNHLSKDALKSVVQSATVEREALFFHLASSLQDHTADDLTPERLVAVWTEECMKLEMAWATKIIETEQSLDKKQPPL